MKLSSVWSRGGSVPGGHFVISDGIRRPFITSMRELNSIPLRESDVVVDIGAYVGTCAIKCARFPVKSVIAFEPSIFSFEILQKNKLPNMKLVQAAVVGDNRKEVEFWLSSGIGVSNGIYKRRGGTRVIVPAIRYEDAVSGASVVKIDIEGYEYNLPSLVRPSIRAFIIDFHRVGVDWINKAERIIADIEAAGFISIIRPKWGHGWTSCGTWVRDKQDKNGNGGFLPMLHGEMCCGCGIKIKKSGVKSLCSKCWVLWFSGHKRGYTLAVS